MKRIILNAALAVLLLLFGSGWFVLNTQWGLDRAYELVKQSIPGKLNIQSLQGKLLGPVRLSGINYVQSDMDIRLGRLEFDWRLASLLTGTLRITEFDAHDLSIRLIDTPHQQESQAPLDLVLPFSIDILQARLTNGSIITDSQPPFIVKKIKLQASASDKSVQLGHLSIETDLFDLITEGTFGLDIKSPLNLKTDWTVRYGHYPPLKGRGKFSGSLSNLDLSQTIQQAGLNMNLQGKLSNITTSPGWDLIMDVKKFNAHEFLTAWPHIANQGKLLSKGKPDSFTLSGELLTMIPKQGTFESTFKLETKPDIWHLTHFEAKHQPTNARLYATGDWHPGPDFGNLALEGNWHNLTFPFTSTIQTQQLRSENGEFTLNGGIKKYNFAVKTDLAGKQIPDTQIKLTGHGNQKQARFEEITVVTLDGHITGSALLGWEPIVSWDVALHAKDINPAVKWRDWPGRLNGRILASRKYADKELYDTLELREINGMLRDYPLEAKGVVGWSNKKISINNFDLTIADSHLRVSGARSNNWDINTILTSPNINHLWPYARGKLDLQISITGPRLSPHIISTINGEKINFEDYRIGDLNGAFDIDLQSDEKFITSLTATDIAKAGRQWQSVIIQADGSRSQHQFSLDLKQENDLIQLLVRGSINEQQVWRGEIAQTLINIDGFGKWQQNRPTAFYLATNKASLEPWCLHQPAALICIEGKRENDIWSAQLVAKDFPLALIDNWMPPHIRTQGSGNIDADLQYVHRKRLYGNLLVSIPDGFQMGLVEREQSLRFGASKLQASLDKTGLVTDVNLPAYEQGYLTLHLSLPDWNALAGLYPAQALTGHISTSLTSLAHLDGFFLDAPVLSGSFNSDLRLAGTIGDPVIIGEATLKQASADIPVLGIKLEDIHLHAQSKNGKRLDYSFSARSGQAKPLTLTGYTLLQASAGWPTKVSIQGDNFEMANLPDIKMFISSQLDIETHGRHIDLNGEVTIPKALFRPRTIPKASVASSQDVVFVGETEPSVMKERWKISSHVRLILGEDVYFDGFGLRGEISGNLLLIDEPGKLTLGQGEIRITEGTYKAYGQDAKIRRGRLIFANTVIDDPAIDLEAVREIDTVTAGVRVTGTLKQPKLSLFSEPAMSESDVASYFLLGRPMQTEEDSEGQQLQRALLAARLAGGELFVDQTGVYSYIDEVSFETDKTTEQTSLVVGKYLSPRLYVRYVTGVVESSNIVEVHYKLKRYLRIQTETGYRGSKSVAGADVYYTIEH